MGTKDNRMIMPFVRLTARSSVGVGESSTYAAITGVDWPMIPSKFPRRRKVENFNSGLRFATCSLTVLDLT